jgi:PadR family transcriptional regulator PadR
MSEQDKNLLNAIQEMRRGTLVLAVLLQLDQPEYGYSLIEALARKGLVIDQNTLYPLLRRLEKLELVESDWQLEENRPRRYYRISTLGTTFRNNLTVEWKNISTVIDAMVTEKA